MCVCVQLGFFLVVVDDLVVDFVVVDVDVVFVPLMKLPFFNMKASCRHVELIYEWLVV